MQTLDLVDADGVPTPTFEAIRLAPEADYQKRLEDWIRNAYAEVFSFVDPTIDDDTRIRDAFRSYQPQGQRDRMVTLFLGLLTAAGVRADKPKTQRLSTEGRPIAAPSIRKKHRLGVNRQKTANPLPGSDGLNLPPALAGLLASLPAHGEGWTKETREKFMTTFGAVLDFCFPVVKHAPNAEKENGGQD